MAVEPSLDIRAGFRPSVTGRTFGIEVAPAGVVVRGGVLFVPAFGEEMHKSRHVVANTARRLAALGLRVRIPDLFGCGDSEGSLADASLSGWLEDLGQEACSLAAQVKAPVHLWGMRAGALLASALCQKADVESALGDVVLWQPALRGRQVLTEFLRLRAAAGLFSTAPRETVDSLRARLANDESLEVAGYLLSAALAHSLDALALSDFPPGPRTVHWIEVSRDAQQAVSPAAKGVVDAWSASGTLVAHTNVSGPPFWRTAELEDCPALVEATVAAIRRSEG